MPVYNSTFDCILKTVRTSGVRNLYFYPFIFKWSGFFRGFSSAVLRQFPDSLVRYSFYETMKRNEIQANGQLSSLKNIVFGAMGGTLGTFIGTPAEVIKVRMVNDFLGTEYSGKTF